LRKDNQSTSREDLLTGEQKVERHAVPLNCSLDAVTEVLPFVEGVTLNSCAPYDVIVLRTANTEYHLLLLDPESGRVLIDGGDRFPEPIEATLLGASFGGSMIRTGWIGVGMRIELCANDKYIITSPVKSLVVEHTLAATELTSDMCH
jgi:hypothetical protein